MEYSGRYKIFLDTVHGYIDVPEEYCDILIDTPQFQRLRRIEQLSSRSLYPCARHDRFVHSLGVYYIGCRFLTAISRHCDVEIASQISTSFQIACLLHDCGHSPFSHTFENLFGKTIDLFQDYKKVIGEKQIDNEIQDVHIDRYDTKPHEIISALLCVTVFYDKIIKLGGSPDLVGRMIMGIKYCQKDYSLQNCFIELLHGDVIDADKFDYICRDKWASGYQSNSVDVERVINSIRLYSDTEGSYHIAYSKSALYEIKSLIDNKNFQNNWIFKHHQVVYDQFLLDSSVKELISYFKSGNKDFQPNHLFNYKSFYDVIHIVEDTNIYMLSDDDIVHFMKCHQDKIPHFKEWMSRDYQLVPIWKTYSEMIAFLGNEASTTLLNDPGNLYNKIEEELKSLFAADVLLIEATPKIKSIPMNKVKICFSSTCIKDYTELGVAETVNTYQNQIFKYIFVPKTFIKKDKNQRERIIEFIKDLIVGKCHQ